MPYSKSPMKKSSCVKMYDDKGKQTGLMMEGSVAHMEYVSKEKKSLMKDMPIDDKASAMEMSPYKMDQGSPTKKTNLDEFGNPIPEGFKADAPEVVGTVRRLSTTHGGNIVDLEEGESVSAKDLYKKRKIEQAGQGYGSQLTKEEKKKVAQKRLYGKNKSAADIAKGLGMKPTITTIKFGK